MSSDTSSLPAWKQALLDRKRHQENGGPTIGAKGDTTRPGAGPGATPNTTEATLVAGSIWKQTSLSKKLQQYTSPSSTDPDKETVGYRTDSTLNHTSGVTELQVELVDDSLIEERLLPIKQNPILLSDRQKRRQQNQTRAEKRALRKSDPRSTASTRSAGSDDNVPSISDDASPATLTEDSRDEVFEEEVTYGKGFVHKLLKKFITLTGKDDPAPTAPPKPPGGVRSTSDVPRGSTRTSNRLSASDKDPTDRKPSKLSTNNDVETPHRSWEEGKETPSTDQRSEVEVHRPEPSGVVDPVELPHNIVSAARDLFEHNTGSTAPTIPTRKKYPALEKPVADRPNQKRSAPEKPIVEATPERPIVEEMASGRNFDSWQSTLQSLAMPPIDREDSGLYTLANSSETPHNVPTGRVSYPAGVSEKSRGTTEKESDPTRPLQEGVKIDKGDRLIVPKIQTSSEKPETAVGNSVGVSQTDDDDSNPSEERTISVRAASKLYEARNERTPNSLEQRLSKNTVKSSTDSLINRSTNTVDMFKPNVSVTTNNREPAVFTKEETTLVRTADRRKTDDTESDSKVATTVHDSTRLLTATSTNARVETNDLQLNQNLSDREKQRDTAVQAPELTTRVRVGSSYASAVETAPNFEYTSGNSSIRTENQVTVIEIGSATPAKLPGKLKDLEEDKYGVGKVVVSDRLVNEPGNTGFGKKPIVIQVGGESSNRVEVKTEGVQDFNGIKGNNRNESRSDARIESRNDTRNESRNDTRNESRNETRNESRNDTRNESRNDTRSDTRNESRNDTRNESRNDTRNESRNETRNESRNDTRNESRNDTRNESRNDTRNDSHRNDTSSRNMTNSTRSEASRRGDDRGSVSRPGMLLIRPASNLVASKTKTEYLTMTKYNDIKKGEFAPAKRPIVMEELMTNGDVVDRGGSGDLRGVEVIGGGVSVGRSLLAKTKRGKLSINFDDSALLTHEYPSEQSLMAATPAQPGDCDYVDENAPMNNDDVSNDNDLKSSSDLLMSSPALSGNLSSYVPRAQVEYEFGMHRSDESAAEVAPPIPAPDPNSRFETTNGPSESVEEDATWSQTESSDMLF